MKSARALSLTLVALFTYGITPGSAETFTNPVVAGDFPDPSVCRVGDDYYLACSSFKYFPGVPILHSRDLVHWRLIGYALTRPSQAPFDRVSSSGGIFAPTLRHHDGVFYLVTTNVGGGGNFYVTAKDPAGLWSEPVWVDREGIDPSLFFDDDGAVYYTRHVGGGDGYIGQATIDLASGKLNGELREVWRGTGGPWAEGPHLYKHGSWWHLIISEGGTSYDHSITVARSRSPWGPFEPCPDNPVLTHRDHPNLPLQAIGHCDLVETPDGFWALCLGVRPRGRLHHLGRETLLTPVSWSEDGWPKFGDDGTVPLVQSTPALKPHPWPDQPVRDEFDGAELALEWNFLRLPNPDDSSLDQVPGRLRLRCSPVTLDDRDTPAFVCRRLTGMTTRAATKLEFSPRTEAEEAGIAVRMVDGWHAEAVVTLRDGKRVALLRKVLGGKAQLVGEPLLLAEGPVELSLETTATEYRFAARDANGATTELGIVTPQELAIERINAVGPNFHFTCARIGLIATSNGATSNGATSDSHADFDWFDYEVVEK